MIPLVSKKRRILDILFYNGKFSLACENCGSVILLTYQEDKALLSKLRVNHPGEILNMKMKCCSNPRWFWTISPKVKFPPKIYYF